MKRRKFLESMSAFSIGSAMPFGAIAEVMESQLPAREQTYLPLHSVAHMSFPCSCDAKIGLIAIGASGCDTLVSTSDCLSKMNRRRTLEAQITPPIQIGMALAVKGSFVDSTRPPYALIPSVLTEDVSDSDIVFIIPEINPTDFGQWLTERILASLREQSIFTITVARIEEARPGSGSLKKSWEYLSALRRRSGALIPLPCEHKSLLGNTASASIEIARVCHWIASTLNQNNVVSIDVDDITEMMSSRGFSNLGYSRGDDYLCVETAMVAAINHPSLGKERLRDVYCVMAHIHGPRRLKMRELNQALKMLRGYVNDEAFITFSFAGENEYIGGYSVTLVANQFCEFYEPSLL